MFRSLLSGLWPLWSVGQDGGIANERSGSFSSSPGFKAIYWFSTEPCQRISESLLLWFLHTPHIHRPLFNPLFLINSLIDKCLICLCVSVSVAVGSLCFKIHNFDCAPQSLKLRRCLLKCILSRKPPSLPFERDAHCSSGV